MEGSSPAAVPIALLASQSRKASPPLAASHSELFLWAFVVNASVEKGLTCFHTFTPNFAENFKLLFVYSCNIKFSFTVQIETFYCLLLDLVLKKLKLRVLVFCAKFHYIF